MKPLGHKSYGSIPHLIGSRLGEGDHHCSPGQVKIATEKARDKHDLIIVQEKLDGGNASVAKIKGEILALTRAGYLATTSIYRTHHAFEAYVRRNEKRFSDLLNDGERVCGEWLFTAVGTKYRLPHEPFVTFDIMRGMERLKYNDAELRLNANGFTMPKILNVGNPLSIKNALEILESGHGALETVEGAIWRVERNGKVDFLCKYVRPDKVDGKYLDQDVFNELPSGYEYLYDAFHSAIIPIRVPT